MLVPWSDHAHAEVNASPQRTSSTVDEGRSAGSRVNDGARPELWPSSGWGGEQWMRLGMKEWATSSSGCRATVWRPSEGNGGLS